MLYTYIIGVNIKFNILLSFNDFPLILSNSNELYHYMHYDVRYYITINIIII